MNYTTVLLVSVALGIDALSVALSIGLAGVNRREIIMVSGAVTTFHVFMPLLGLSLGHYLGQIAGPLASAIGALVLITIGTSTIWKSLRELGIFGRSPAEGGAPAFADMSNPISLVLMAASVSLDALTVGFGLGTLKVDLFLTVVTMGVVAGIMAGLGLIFGRRLNVAFGERAEILGGVILIIIGLKLLLF